MSFDYSTLKSGDLVDVSTEWDFSNPVAGVVWKPEPDCAFIQVLGSPDPPLEFCWHREDDRVLAGPEQFKYQQDLLSGAGETEHTGPRTGVFQLSRSQELIEAMPQKMAAFERQLMELTARVAELSLRVPETANEPVEEEIPRRRGRPRRIAEPATVG